MNTPTHIILSYTLLRAKCRSKYDVHWIIFGGILPDLAIFILPIYGIVTGYSMRDVWDTLYFTHPWQNIIDTFNSVPLILCILLIALLMRWRSLALLSVSMCIHVLGDIFLHNDDAHRHFFPLSDYRLVSHVSYWDPAHYGHIGILIELTLLLIATIALWHYLQTKRWKLIIIVYCMLIALLTTRSLITIL